MAAHPGALYVVEARGGGPVDPRNLSRWVRGLAKKAGVETNGVHALRHGWATRAIEGGVPLTVVSRVMGHSSIQVTADVYFELGEQAARNAVGAVAAALG